MKVLTYKSGYSLVEMLIYVSILSVISFLMVSTVLSFIGSYRQLVALRIVEHSGIDAMEKMTRDIRAGTTIYTMNNKILLLKRFCKKEKKKEFFSAPNFFFFVFFDNPFLKIKFCGSGNIVCCGN